MMQQGSLISLSPSFNSYSSSRLAEIAARVIGESEETIIFYDDNPVPEEPVSDSNDQSQKTHQQEQEQEQEQVQEDKEDDEEDEEDDDDFEFAFVCRDPDATPISADEIFSNGQIRPVFPLFNRDLLFADGNDDDSKPPTGSSTIRLPLRKLMIEDRDPHSCSSSEADDLEGLTPGTYCVWTPKSTKASPDGCKKSSSTGSSKRWKFRDLLHRSNSDGKDTYIFLAPSPSSLKTKKREEKSEKSPAEKTEIPKEKRNSSEVKVAGNVKAKGISGEKVSAHEIHYVRNRALKEVDRRRSYLPYRQDLVGLFSNVNGLSRTLHPPF